MWIYTLVMAGAVAADAVPSPCDAPATTVTLGAALDRAEAAFSDLDTDRFADEMEGARTQVPCLEETVPTSLAASLHRFEGLSAFLSGSPERARRAFAAARSLEPAYRFSRAVVPEGNPVLDDYEALDLSEGRFAPVPPPAEGTVRLDGRATTDRSTSFPVLFQRTDAAGSVAQSDYLWPSMPLPDYPTAPPPDAPGGKVDVAAVGLFAGAGVAAISSGVLYGLAKSHQRAFDDPATPYGELAAEQRATNSLGTASGVSLGVALGAGLGGVLVGVF